ncbi:MAG: dynamin family protein [Nannocystaceae bacterium]
MSGDDPTSNKGDEPREQQGDNDLDSAAETAVSAIRGFGAALGGWARRVGKVITDAAAPDPASEEIKFTLAEITNLRLAGRFSSARERVRTILQERPRDIQALTSYGLTLVAETICDQRAPSGLVELLGELSGHKQRPAIAPLLEAALKHSRGEHDGALDDLRRGTRVIDNLPANARREGRFYHHLLGTMAQASRGRPDRALLELHKARASVPEQAAGALLRRFLLEGVAVLLAEDHLDEAIAWLTPLALPQKPAPEADAETGAASDAGESEAAAPSQPAPEEPLPEPSPNEPLYVARGLLAEALAAKGDRDGALALIDDLPDEPAWDGVRIRVGLSAGATAALKQRALRHLQVAPEDWQRARLWALTEVAAWAHADGPPPEAAVESVLEALVKATDAAPPGLRDGFIHELAHVTLRADAFPEAVLAVLDRRLHRDGDTAAEELRLVRARNLIIRGDLESAGQDFIGSQAPRFRSQPDLGGPWGPDAVSPLRDSVTRLRTLRSQRALAAAEYCLKLDLTEQAQELLVEALAESPNLSPARHLLTTIARPATSSRLEDLLAAATTVLAALPSHVLGVPLGGAQEALSGVIAARERLARPLTIAVMGEFSSGKSTFVNALLGEAIAPMGVLPTTTTINVFRRGPTGGARIYFRDDRVGTLQRGDIHNFLHSLDDVRASQIRHVEIERTGARMGDASVVDTPGLNALDAFHERVAREFIDEADAVIWIFSATRGSTASEAGMLSTLRADGRQVLGVLNKVDTLDDDERVELIDYLKEQLADVLVDIVPVCASEALKVRAGEGEPGADDSFAAVEESLELHFLQRARELKRRLTTRRLNDSLKKARGACESAAGALEAAADGAAGSDQLDTLRSAQRLLSFADRMYEAVLGLDDLLVRECLALGILRSGAGMTRETLGLQDSWYLTTVVRDNMLKSLQSALAELSREADTEILYDVLTQNLVPWARGYLDGLGASGWLVRLITENGPAITKGESALRDRLRVALTPMAATWQKFVRSLDRPLRQAQVQAHRQAATRPRAEALRLRTSVISGLDGLLESVRELEA